MNWMNGEDESEDGWEDEWKDDGTKKWEHEKWRWMIRWLELWNGK